MVKQFSSICGPIKCDKREGEEGVSKICLGAKGDDTLDLIREAKVDFLRTDDTLNSIMEAKRSTRLHLHPLFNSSSRG